MYDKYLKQLLPHDKWKFFILIKCVFFIFIFAERHDEHNIFVSSGETKARSNKEKQPVRSGHGDAAHQVTAAVAAKSTNEVDARVRRQHIRNKKSKRKNSRDAIAEDAQVVSRASTAEHKRASHCAVRADFLVARFAQIHHIDEALRVPIDDD